MRKRENLMQKSPILKTKSIKAIIEPTLQMMHQILNMVSDTKQINRFS